LIPTIGLINLIYFAWFYSWNYIIF